MKYTKNWHLLLILSITVSFFSCERINSDKEVRESKGGVAIGGELALAISQYGIDLDPMMMNNASSTFIGNQIHGTLLKNSPGLDEPTPCVAERWELDETGTILLFHIRKGMTFQRQECIGAPLEITATDVLISLTRICSSDATGGIFDSFRSQIEGGEAFYEGESQTVSGIEALDDYRLKITLNKPNQAFIHMLTEPATGVVHICENGKTVASGPFAPVFNEGELTLIRNESYAIQDQFGNQLPYLDKVVFKNFGNTSEELDGFFAGELDLVTNIYQDPIRKIMNQHIADFAGKNPKYVIKREDEMASYELYTLLVAELSGYEMDYLGRPDLSRVTMGSQD